MLKLSNGYSVKFYHNREMRFEGFEFPEDRANPLWTVATCGGSTRADIIDHEGRVIASGYSHCSPKDTFCKKIGRDKALRRAIYGFANDQTSDIIKDSDLTMMANHYAENQ